MDIDDNLNNADEKEEVAEIDIVIFNVKLTIQNLTNEDILNIIKFDTTRQQTLNEPKNPEDFSGIYRQTNLFDQNLIIYLIKRL